MQHYVAIRLNIPWICFSILTKDHFKHKTNSSRK